MTDDLQAISGEHAGYVPCDEYAAVEPASGQDGAAVYGVGTGFVSHNAAAMAEPDDVKDTNAIAGRGSGFVAGPCEDDCGITDTFDPNEFNSRPDGASVGIADCGRTWAYNPARPVTIDDNQMSMPTGIVGHTSASLPGNYPVPFNGRIYSIDPDIHAGFTYVTTIATQYGLGAGTWNDHYAAYVDGSAAHIESIMGTASYTMRSDRRVFNPEAGMSVTGHIAVVETLAGFDDLDRYVRVAIGIGYVSIVPSMDLDDPTYGVTGDPEVACLFLEATGGAPGPPFAVAYFPANFWRDTGECDFTITYTGGDAGLLSADFGGVSASITLDPGETGEVPFGGGKVGGFNHSYSFGTPAGGDESDAELVISNLLIDDQPITDLNSEWQLNGTVSDGGGVAFRFGYVSMGGAIPFPFNGFPEPDPGPELGWPYTIPSPAIWAYRQDGFGEQLTVTPLVGDIGAEFTFGVTIVGTTATLDIDGNVASVDSTFPVATLIGSMGGLTHMVRNGQGERWLWNDLDVVGVNNCTG